MRGIIYNNSQQVFRVSYEKLADMSAHNEGDFGQPVQSTIDMVKLLRVHGGCLGVERR